MLAFIEAISEPPPIPILAPSPAFALYTYWVRMDQTDKNIGSSKYLILTRFNIIWLSVD
jgi:hypothetical protein